MTGLQSKLSREQAMRGVRRAEQQPRDRSEWTSIHGDDHLWASGQPASLIDQELERMYREFAQQHYAAYGNVTMDSVTGSDVTEGDLMSLFTEDEDDAWDPMPGAPASSSGDSDAQGQGAPPAGDYDDFC